MARPFQVHVSGKPSAQGFSLIPRLPRSTLKMAFYAACIDDRRARPFLLVFVPADILDLDDVGAEKSTGHNWPQEEGSGENAAEGPGNEFPRRTSPWSCWKNHGLSLSPPGVGFPPNSGLAERHEAVDRPSIFVQGSSAPPDQIFCEAAGQGGGTISAATFAGGITIEFRVGHHPLRRPIRWASSASSIKSSAAFIMTLPTHSETHRTGPAMPSLMHGQAPFGALGSDDQVTWGGDATPNTDGMAVDRGDHPAWGDPCNRFSDEHCALRKAGDKVLRGISPLSSASERLAPAEKARHSSWSGSSDPRGSSSCSTRFHGPKKELGINVTRIACVGLAELRRGTWRRPRSTVVDPATLVLHRD